MSGGKQWRVPAATGLILAGGAACADLGMPPEPIDPNLGIHVFKDEGAIGQLNEQLTVCKTWTDGTTDIVTEFDVTVADPGGANASTVRRPIGGNGMVSHCKIVAEFDGTAPGSHVGFGEADLTVVELVPPGTEFEKIVVVEYDWFQNIIREFTIFPDDLNGGPPTWAYLEEIEGQAAGAAIGFVIEFFNRVSPPGGGQGCTPGYWKQSHHFDSWPAPYTPSTLFSDVFADAFPGKTLHDVLNARGGKMKGALGNLNALGRHTVAALLNAASDGVSYDLTVGDVVNGFNAAFAAGDYRDTKNEFEYFNEQGCPLN